MERLVSQPRFTQIHCTTCMDSLWTWKGTEPRPKRCSHCGEHLNRNAARVDSAIEGRIRDATFIHRSPFDLVRLLIYSSSEKPIPRNWLEDALCLNERGVKNVVRYLRRSWLLPICSRRDQPNGYWLAQTASECEEWFNTLRSQALDELSTIYKTKRANFPEFAGQTAFAFIDEFSEEFREVVK